MSQITIDDLPIREVLSEHDAGSVVGGSINNLMRLSGSRNGDGPTATAAFAVNTTGRLNQRLRLGSTRRRMSSRAAAGTALTNLKSASDGFSIRVRSSGPLITSSSSNLLSSWRPVG